MRTKLALLASLGVAAVACSQVETTDDTEASDGALRTSKIEVSADTRASYLAQGNVWLTPDPARIRNLTPAELQAGPPGGFPFNADLTCDYVEANRDDQLGGMTPKFECKLPSGEVVKVKYSRDAHHNREIFSEVIGTRLMWALGLAADRVYPVHVTCNNCPEEPWAEHVQLYGSTYNKLRYRKAGPRATRRFELAAIERKFEAPKIEGPDGTAGWSWKELPQRPAEYWTGSRESREAYDRQHPEQAELDAFRLLAAWMKHADNKADNQRLVCAGGASEGGCSEPLLMIHDTGITFGGGTVMEGADYAPKALLQDWTNRTKFPIWKSFAECRASLEDSLWTGSMRDPRIAPVGQRFLAARLAELSDDQLRAIFRAARVEQSEDPIVDETTGKERFVGVEDWVAGFKTMRELVSWPCPEPK